MEQIKLKASLREGTGKEKAKKMRESGQIPAVVYHRGESPVPVIIDDKEMRRILHASEGENVLISLTIEKDKKKGARTVIIKEIQNDPVKRDILHVDFNEISMTEKITVDVELVAVGEAVGVKQEGGMLDHPLREVKIQCLPGDIPKHIDVDVSGLKLNDSLHVKDIKVSDKIKILNDPELLIFQVKIHEEKVETEAAAETPELEVIREKKDEAGAAPAAPAAEKKEEPKADKK